MNRNTVAGLVALLLCCGAMLFSASCSSLRRDTGLAVRDRPDPVSIIPSSEPGVEELGRRPAALEPVREDGIPEDGRLIRGHNATQPMIPEDRVRLRASWSWPAKRSAGRLAILGSLPPGPEYKKEPWEQIGMDEDVWIIAKAEGPTERDPKRPTQGELRAKREDKEIPLPLKHTAVSARISAFIASVDVVQQYENPYETKIEAVYVFPLPASAAVTDFVMTIGERRIRGLVRERKEAEELYAEAKRQGYRAALLTQERPNVFTQKVANIEPGKRIDVQISYFCPLPYRDGEYEFVFPMVVGPRFNPPGSKDGVGAAPRGARGASGQSTEVEYLKPGERSGHDISLALEIYAGVELEKIYSRTHRVRIDRSDPSCVRVALDGMDRIPNRDFVLRYKVAGDRLKTAFLTNRSDKGNTFALVLQPPAKLSDTARMPREMVFVLDCSGSMRGAPIAMAKRAVKRCLRNLDADDTFQIIRFSQRASAWGARPVPATRENVAKALRYVDELRGSGGTMMIDGIKAALEFPHEQGRLRVVSFMTDGLIGNEAQILAAVEQRLGASRIFSFGIGNSVNRYLLEQMASFGKGAAAFVGLDESAAEKVDLFYDRLARPALTDIEIDWGGMKVSELYPRVIPDVFVGRPVLITGRFEGSGSTTVTVKGRAGGEPASYGLAVDLDEDQAEHAGITSLWARWKIKELSNAEIRTPDTELKDEILRTSIEYNLLCRYSAFLAVDSLERTQGDHGVSVNVPVPVPDGVRYDTTVGGEVGSRKSEVGSGK